MHCRPVGPSPELTMYHTCVAQERFSLSSCQIRMYSRLTHIFSRSTGIKFTDRIEPQLCTELRVLLIGCDCEGLVSCTLIRARTFCEAERSITAAARASQHRPNQRSLRCGRAWERGGGELPLIEVEDSNGTGAGERRVTTCSTISANWLNTFQTSSFVRRVEQDSPKGSLGRLTNWRQGRKTVYRLREQLRHEEAPAQRREC